MNWFGGDAFVIFGRSIFVDALETGAMCLRTRLDLSAMTENKIRVSDIEICSLMDVEYSVCFILCILTF